MPDRIVALTLDPTVDVAADADAVRPSRKARTCGETFNPGGDGVNMSRVRNEPVADIVALILAGVVSGRLLVELPDENGAPRASVAV